MEDSSLSEAVTGKGIMSRPLLPLCVSAGGTTRLLNAAVEQLDTHTQTHTHARMQTHAHTHQADRPTQTTAHQSACCQLCLTLELHESLLQLRAACA